MTVKVISGIVFTTAVPLTTIRWQGLQTPCAKEIFLGDDVICYGRKAVLIGIPCLFTLFSACIIYKVVEELYKRPPPPPRPKPDALTIIA